MHAPPTELVFHEKGGRQTTVATCDDIAAAEQHLEGKRMKPRALADPGRGLATKVELAEGDELGFHEPRHPSPPR